MPELEEQETKHETKKSLLSFELPEVSEQTNDFIDSDEENAQVDETPHIPLGESQGESIQVDPAEQHRGALDNKGNPYDPAIHAYPPEMTGKLQKWKRKPKAQREQQTKVDSNAMFRKQAQNFAYLYANAHVTLFGQSGEMDKEALMPLVDSLETYFQEEGLKELSPKAQVLLSGVNYSTVICTREKNAEKLKRWFNPLVTKVKKLLKLDKKEKAVLHPNDPKAENK